MDDLLKLIVNATLVAAVLGGVATLVKLWRASVQKREMAMRTLFSELEHIARHYAISAVEILDTANGTPVLRRLRWAKYGPVAAASAAGIKDNVLLGTQQIAQVLQLSFVIRNTDTYIDELLAHGTDPSPDELRKLADRMRTIPAYAGTVVNYIRDHNRGFAPMQWDAKA